MCSRINLLGTLLSLCLVGQVPLAEAQDRANDTAEAETQRKLDELSARLSKLDFIAEQVEKLRNDDLRRIQRDIRESSTATKTVTRKEVTPAPELAQNEVPNLPVAGTLEERLAAIERQLRKLDDIAEQIDALRREDLPKIHRSMRGLTETAAKVGDGVTMGRVVIENISGISRDVTLNATTYRVGPGTTEFIVPYAPVTTHLVAWESPKRWDLNFWRQTERGPELKLEMR